MGGAAGGFLELTRLYSVLATGTGDQAMPDRKTEDQLDDALEGTFPASDPPSHTPVDGTKKSREIEEANKTPAGDNEPKGVPTSDRQATERAAES